MTSDGTGHPSHRWGYVLGQPGLPFPRVCADCLVREDRPDAAQPCDDQGGG